MLPPESVLVAVCSDVCSRPTNAEPAEYGSPEATVLVLLPVPRYSGGRAAVSNGMFGVLRSRKMSSVAYGLPVTGSLPFSVLSKPYMLRMSTPSSGAPLSSTLRT